MSWAGHRFTGDDVTIADAAFAQIETNDGWRSVDPLAGPNHAATLLAILVARVEERRYEDVLLEIAARPAAELVAALGPADPPQAARGGRKRSEKA